MADEVQQANTIHTTDKQYYVLKCMVQKIYSLIFGGSRSGKSFIILLRMLSIASKHPCRQLVVRFHFTDVKKSVVLETLPKIAEMMGISYHLNQQDWFITIQNGTKEPSEIWFGGIDEGRGLDRILGKEYLNIWFNEASEITYNAYQTVITLFAPNVLLRSGTHCMLFQMLR